MNDIVKRAPAWVRVVAWLTILAALLALLAGPLNRFGIVDFRVALTILRYAAIAAGIGAILCLIAAFATRPGTGKAGFPLAIVALIAGVAAFAVPFMMMQTAKRVPPIHDITTDTVNPPQFVDVLPLRKDALNPTQYGGAEVAAQQEAAYPDIRTVTLAVSPSEAFDKAYAAMTDLGWDIVAAVSAEGRIEATATTPWFGFKDDVVVRVTPVAGGSAVDIRSESRVGKSDLGANAARIRKLMARLKA
jgi:uncharacterized protein (DUF1499 family)